MANLARLKPFYVTLAVRNNGLDKFNVETPVSYSSGSSADNTIKAEILTDYNTPLVEKASDYLLCVERMEVSLNAIPFYDCSSSIYWKDIVIMDMTVTNMDGSHPTSGTLVNKTCYSLTELLSYLSYDLEFEHPTTEQVFHIYFTISKDGYISMDIGSDQNYTWNDINVLIPRRLNMILGFSTTAQSGNDWVLYSTFPRIDLGDDLQNIVVQSNLPTYTDSIDNQKVPILTDFGVPSSYSNSLSYNIGNQVLSQSGWSIDVRDKYIYAPSERRFIELLGDFPINNIQIRAFYVNPDGDSKLIPLCLGGDFLIKLGFYLRQ